MHQVLPLLAVHDAAHALAEVPPPTTPPAPARRHARRPRSSSRIVGSGSVKHRPSRCFALCFFNCSQGPRRPPDPLANRSTLRADRTGPAPSSAGPF